MTDDLITRLREFCNSKIGNYRLRLMAGEAADRIEAQEITIRAAEAAQRAEEARTDAQAREIEQLQREAENYDCNVAILTRQRDRAEAEVQRLRELVPILDGLIGTPCPTPGEWKKNG